MRALILSAIMLSVLASCSWFQSTPRTTVVGLQSTPPVSQLVKITLVVRALTPLPYNVVGQVIKYSYTIKNTGVEGAPGPVSVTGATAICPDVNTVGNLDNNLDVNESLVCVSSYTITQADLDRGSVTSVNTASLSGVLSNEVTTNLPTAQAKALILAKSANPTTYNQAGQTITYTYVIKNGGIENLGPAQFTVTDTGIGNPINCGDANTSLTPNATVTCSATYVITQADLNASELATTAIAAGGGAEPSKPATAKITKGDVVQTNPSNLTPGSTIQHKVAAGEWIIQIARCYGADYKKVIQANPQLASPSQISPNTTLTVPNIGSAGKIYGPPCVVAHTVVAGETWTSIAQKYNASVAVLQRVNPGTLTAGKVINVALNSAGLAAP
jgi:LysM repeat protein